MTFTVLPSPLWVAADHNRVLEAHGLVTPAALPAGVTTTAFAARGGSWARVEKLPAGALRLSVDRNLSVPLYYGMKRPGSHCFIGLSATAVAAACGANQRNANGSLALRNCGFTLGADTLYEGVYCVPAGSSITLKDGVTHPAKPDTWGAAHWQEPRLTDATAFGAQLLRALMDSLKETLQAGAEARLLVPVNGSAQSRLLLLLLKLLGAKNVLAYSSGHPAAPQAQLARALTTALDIPWIQINPSAQLLEQWDSALSRDYIAATWSGFALPQLHDFAALLSLREQGLVDTGDVVLSDAAWCGQVPLPAAESDFSAANSARLLAQMLWNLQGRGLGQGTDREIWRDALAATTAAVNWRGDRATTETLLNWFIAQGRHAKFAGTRLRGYEYFGLRWAQPLATDAVFTAWYRGAPEFTATPSWYHHFVDDLWADSAGAPAPHVASRKLALESGWRSNLAQTFRSLTGRGNDAVSAQQVRELPHWRAYCAQVPAKQLDQQLANGVTPYGIFANLFLANNWGTMAQAATPIVPV